MKTNPKKRFFEYGFTPGLLARGKKNTIADVSGVRVGHVTKIEGSDIRTGVTVIDPGIKSLFMNKLPAAVEAGNGFGKLAGSTQVDELGTLEAPIALTNTHSVGPVLRGIVDIVLEVTKGISPLQTVNAVVGETNDGFLNAIHKDAVTKADAVAAYASATSDIALGCVGAGTGTRLFAWKGGIGSASRVAWIEGKNYILGALLQANFGGELVVQGIPIGRRLGKNDFGIKAPRAGDGSCIIVLATDAPLTARQLGRIAKRAFVGLARTGSVLSHGSGDYAIAFSTRREGVEGSGAQGTCLTDELCTPLFLAAAETVEESVYDALFLGETMRGRDGNVLEAFPVEEALRLMSAAARTGIRINDA